MKRTAYFPIKLSHKCCIAQYSALNAWNANFSNANVNNNNKFNSYRVRACSDFLDIAEACAVPLESIIEAELECRKHKRGTEEEQLWETNATRNNITLWLDIINRTYAISPSRTFVVTSPVPREIFAGTYRDRIMQHWIAIRLVPIFEEILPDSMMSNRKGRGTKGAIGQVTERLYNESEGYSKEVWIWKYDIQGFFMSIDKKRLNGMLQDIIDKSYKGADKETLKWLTEMVVTHCPQRDCIFTSPRERWKLVKPGKSLFDTDDSKGLPIGNLTSQIFANIYLTPVARFLEGLGLDVTCYVDDGVVVTADKDLLLRSIPLVRIFMTGNLGLRLHPKKQYIQQGCKGVSFVGAIIKPWRNYPSARLRRNALDAVHKAGIHGMVYTMSVLNSYFGLTRRLKARKVRERMAADFTARWKHRVYCTGNYYSMKPNKRYSAKNMCRNHVVMSRKMYNFIKTNKI